MADEYDPFNLRKHPGYYAELVQERDPTQDVAASYVKNHQYDGGILGQLERNPHGLGDSPLPFDPSGAELRSTSEGGSAFTERPKDHLQPVAELISPTLGAFGAGQMAGTAYKEAGEGDYQEAGMSLAPLLAGMVVPGAPKGARGPKVLSREIDARGFYSPSLEAVKGLGQESGTVQQFRSMLLKAGGKPKELEAVGFDRAFPDPNAKVSRQEIEQYLRDNRVQLGERTFGQEDMQAKHDALTKQWQAIEAKGSARTDADWAEMDRILEEQQALRPAVRQEEPRYASYSTPGGIPGSYREVVTTLPVAKSEPVFDPAKVQIKRNRQSATQGTYEILYDGKKLAGPYGDDGTPQTNYMRPEADIIETARGVFERGDMRNKFPAVQDNYTSSHWPGITNPVLHYRQKDFLNHADPTSVAALEKVTQPFEVRPMSEVKLHDIGQASYTTPYRIDPVSNVPLSSLKGAHFSPEKVGPLADTISQNKWIEPLVVDRDGNVIEGQHRLRALQKLGVNSVPVHRLREIGTPQQINELVDAARGAGKIHREQGQQIADQLAKIIDEEGVAALDSYEAPRGFEAPWNAAIAKAKTQNWETPSPQSGSGEGTTLGGAFRSPESNLPSKTRVLDEMQSDWAQRARDQGTRDDAAMADIDRQLAETGKTLDALNDQAFPIIRDKFGFQGGDNLSASYYLKGALSRGTIESTPELKAWLTKFEETENAKMDLSNKLHAARSGVPSAPYISNTSDWVDLGLKQALIDAAKDPSVNRLAWAPGGPQADRYNLRRNGITAMRYNPDTQQFGFQRSPGDWQYESLAASNESHPRNKTLEHWVGEDVAKQLRAAPRNAPPGANHLGWHELATDSMDVGGHGMKGFYGDMKPDGTHVPGIVTSRLQKLVKGLDPEAARVEPHGIRQGNTEIANKMWTDMRDAQPGLRQEQASQLVKHIEEIVFKEGPEALATYDPPPGFERAWARGAELVAEGHKRGAYTQTYPSVKITPAMREKILKEGLPLFNVAALSALLSRILGQGQPDTEGEDGGGF
jgi:hypothetical protein